MMQERQLTTGAAIIGTSTTFAPPATKPTSRKLLLAGESWQYQLICFYNIVSKLAYCNGANSNGRSECQGKQEGKLGQTHSEELREF